MKTLLIASASLLLLVPALSQTRREKLDSILRLQDARVPFGGAMESFLRDADPAVRTRAALACGSLQDTSAIPLLTVLLADADSGAQDAAAFALGQSGARLCETGRRSLETALIRDHCAGANASGRLIEEIGKFGSAQGLEQLVASCGESTSPRTGVRLMMSIARFAIRGISVASAVEYLLHRISQGETAPWQAVYALQRTGDTPRIRESLPLLAGLDRSADPLVRMNLAALLGKLRGTAGAAELAGSMAESDGDWRVRVNALKALGQFPLGGDVRALRIFRRAFIDGNLHIGITALSSLSGTGISPRDTGAEVRETLRVLGVISENLAGRFPWQLQAEAAGARAKIEGVIPAALLTGATIVPGALKARLIAAAGASGDPRAERVLNSASEGGEPAFVCAALEGRRALLARNPADLPLRDSTYASALRALRIHDMAVIATAADLLGDTLLRRESSVEPMLEAFGVLRAPVDIEAMQDIVGALGKITGRDYSGMLPTPSRPAGPDSVAPGILPPGVTAEIETSRGLIVIALDPENAPITTRDIVNLARRGFYRGLTFHRVVPNFVVQGGDPRGDGWGGPGYTLRSEFSPGPYGTGTVGIASAGKDTEGSQFFITHSPQPHLDGRYTIIGKVVRGMEVADRIQVGDRIIDIRILP